MEPEPQPTNLYRYPERSKVCQQKLAAYSYKNTLGNWVLSKVETLDSAQMLRKPQGTF